MQFFMLMRITIECSVFKIKCLLFTFRLHESRNFRYIMIYRRNNFRCFLTMLHFIKNKIYKIVTKVYYYISSINDRLRYIFHSFTEIYECIMLLDRQKSNLLHREAKFLNHNLLLLESV